MSSLLIKIFLVPIALILCDWLFPGVDYGAYSQAVFLGLIIAAVGTVMEFLLLHRGTVWLSTLVDFAAAFVLVYFVSNIFSGTTVTLLGALLTAVVLAIAEHYIHLWLVRSGRIRKSAEGL